MFLGGVVLVSLFWLVAVLALGGAALWRKFQERRWRKQREQRGRRG
jgi:MYXO-CTERM domain-containing protein